MGRFIVKDRFYEKAKQQGYRARSAYKLLEIEKRFRIFKRGDKVLDLGAAPGGWLQVISSLTGEKGLVAGIDLIPIVPLEGQGVRTKVADIRAMDVGELLAELSIPSFDVITCDIAPNLSGIRDVDEARIAELYETVVNVVRQALKKGGTFILKSFFGPLFKQRVEDLKGLFGRVTIYKPAASRGVSSEIYLVATGKK